MSFFCGDSDCMISFWWAIDIASETMYSHLFLIEGWSLQRLHFEWIDIISYLYLYPIELGRQIFYCNGSSRFLLSLLRWIMCLTYVVAKMYLRLHLKCTMLFYWLLREEITGNSDFFDFFLKTEKSLSTIDIMFRQSILWIPVFLLNLSQLRLTLRSTIIIFTDLKQLWISIQLFKSLYF